MDTAETETGLYSYDVMSENGELKSIFTVNPCFSI